MIHLSQVNRVAGLLIIAVFVLNGCELFQTREPEPPTGISSGNWKFPRNPETVLSNLMNSVGRRSSADYMLTFSSSNLDSVEFRFEPDQQSLNNHPAVFENWNFERERKHVALLFDPSTLPLDSIASLTFDVDRHTVLNDSASIVADYKLHLGHIYKVSPTQMTGRMEFRLKRDIEGGWFVYHWIDMRIATDACWSDIKAQF